MIAKIGKNNFIVNMKRITFIKLTDLFTERKSPHTLCQRDSDLLENLTVS